MSEKVLAYKALLHTVKYINTKNRAEGMEDKDLEAFEALLDKKLDLEIDEAIRLSREIINS